LTFKSAEELAMSALGQSRHKWQRPTLLLVRFAPKATLALQRSESREVPEAEVILTPSGTRRELFIAE
jgi:hypothetical protein